MGKAEIEWDEWVKKQPISFRISNALNNGLMWILILTPPGGWIILFILFLVSGSKQGK